MLNLLSEYTEKIIESLDITWKGMLAIAIVVVLCITATFIMIAIDKKIKSVREKKASEQSQTTPTDESSPDESSSAD